MRIIDTFILALDKWDRENGPDSRLMIKHWRISPAIVCSLMEEFRGSMLSAMTFDDANELRKLLGIDVCISSEHLPALVDKKGVAHPL